MGSDDVAALLAGIKERYEYLGPLYRNTNFMLDAVVQDIPPLVAAVEAVLNLHTRQDKPVLCWDHVCDAHRSKRGLPVQPPPRDCPGCRFHEMRVCQYCSCPNDEWPCPTVRAITAALTGEEASRG